MVVRNRVRTLVVVSRVSRYSIMGHILVDVETITIVEVGTVVGPLHDERPSTPFLPRNIMGLRTLGPTIVSFMKVLPTIFGMETFEDAVRCSCYPII